MPNKFLVFKHIEKNGGITLHSIFHNIFPGYISPRPNYGKVFSKLELEKLQKLYPIHITGIGGHRINTLEDYRPNQFLFTFLRDPVDRYLSHLNFQISKMGINWKLEEFIENEYFNNFQTYRITKDKNIDSAKKIIQERFSFIGLMEDYNKSLIYLSLKLDNPFIRQDYIIRNVSSHASNKYVFSNLNKNTQRKITENNKVDIELYEYVKNNIYNSYKTDYNALKYNSLSTGNEIKENDFGHFKRKLSNIYIGRLLQPFYLKQQKNESGY